MFCDKNKTKEVLDTKPPLEKLLKGNFFIRNKGQIHQRGHYLSINNNRTINQKMSKKITQINKMKGTNTNLSKTTLYINCPNSPWKRHRLIYWIGEKKSHHFVASKK